MSNKTFLDKLSITLEEFDAVYEDNPSLRGTIIGYLAETKLRGLLAENEKITVLPKPDDHDRTQKYDLPIEYKGHTFKIEVKSLQTSSIKIPQKRKGVDFQATVQCDASDCRTIVLPNGKTVTTTCLQYGDFDILAVNMYMFNKKWEFAFALNEQIPHSGKGSKKHPIPKNCQKYLMKTSVSITYPIEGIFTSDICSLMDHLIEKKERLSLSFL